MKKQNVLNFIKEYTVVIVMVLLAAIFTIGNPEFLTASN